MSSAFQVEYQVKPNSVYGEYLDRNLDGPFTVYAVCMDTYLSLPV